MRTISSRRKGLNTLAEGGTSDYLRYQAWDFTAGAGLDGWVIPGAAEVVNNALVITPTEGAELLTDPGLEAAYTAGRCNTMTASGSPTLTESADAHNGTKAQQFKANAQNDRLIFPQVARQANEWYLATGWGKLTAGSSGNVFMRFAHLAVSGQDRKARITAASYAKLAANVRTSGSANNLGLYSTYDQATSNWATVITDDFHLAKLTLATCGIYRPLNGLTTYKLSVLPAAVNESTAWGIWVCVDNPANPQNGVLLYAIPEAADVLLLTKMVNGVYTDTISLSSVGLINPLCYLTCIREGNTFSVYNGSAQIGTTQTISDVGEAGYYGVFNGYAGNTFAKAAIQPASSKRIAIIGDSISASANGWDDLFVGRYNYGGNLGFNRAVSGATVLHTGSTTDMQDEVTTASSDNADLILVLLGTNDTDTSATFGTEYQARLAEMKTQHPNASISCLGILERFDGITRRTLQNPMIQAAAAAVGETYINTDGVITAGDTTDNLHLNAAGHAKLYALVSGVVG
jgi:lysophospholipase L1-like esterase